MDLNRSNWDARVPHHLVGYELQKYVDDRKAISEVVRFDLPRLGSIDGLDVVHLQCHIGTDTLSLARLGPCSVTGLDFSSASIAAARDLVSSTGDDVEFVESDVYAAVATLGPARFDLVYTGVGALCWIPSIERWAQTVAGLLRPGGRVFVRDAHPMMLALDEERADGTLPVEYPYFESAGVEFVQDKSYVEHEGTIVQPRSVEFNHGLAEMFNAMWSHGLQIDLFEEHDTVPWCQFGEQYMEEVIPNEWRLIDRPQRVAMSFTVAATKGSGLG